MTTCIPFGLSSCQLVVWITLIREESAGQFLSDGGGFVGFVQVETGSRLNDPDFMAREMLLEADCVRIYTPARDNIEV